MESPGVRGGSDNAAWRDVPPFRRIDAQLARVSGLIHHSLSAGGVAGEISPLFDHLNARGGKLIRPALVLLAGECFGPTTDDHIRVAAMVEMIHHATLLHDDVIDDGNLRRGVPTVNRLWGNESAVLLGDFVLSRVFRMAADLEGSVSAIIAQTAMRVCEGELRQVSQRCNWQLGEAEYIDIITDKSASFFGGCCRLGAMLSRAAREHVEAVARFGLLAGVAFQIVDDLLDITGEESRMGKTGNRDVSRDKLTLAVIHLLRTTDEPQRARVQAMLESRDESRRELADVLRRAGSLRYAQQQAEEYVTRAVQTLDDLPAVEARDALIETARFMADRTA